MIEVAFFCGALGCAIGSFMIAPAVVEQRLDDDIMAGEFDSDDQWNRAVASIASTGTHMSNAHLSTRLLRLLSKLLLPRSKRFRVSWCGDIFLHNV